MTGGNSAPTKKETKIERKREKKTMAKKEAFLLKATENIGWNKFELRMKI